MDQVDYMILKQLQHNAKTSIKEIASQVHLSAPSVAERVKKLEEQGVIVGYQAKINLKKIECPIVALILFKSADCKSLASFCYTHPDVIECYRVAGEISYIAKIATSSVETLEDVTVCVSTRDSCSISRLSEYPIGIHSLKLPFEE